MKKITIVLLVFISQFTILFSQTIDTVKINELINHIEINNRSVGSISIFNQGKEVYNKTFGQNDEVKTALKNNQYPETPNSESRYQIGSISKMITAVLIFKLIEDKKLTLDDKLSSYFPKIKNSKKITIKHMLEHRSGLGDYVIKNDSMYWLQKPVSENEIMKEIIRQGSEFKPGKKVRYSNSAYFLLTKIVELEFKKEYAQIVDEIICKPLQLKHIYSSKLGNKNKLYSLDFNPSWKRMSEFDFNNVIGVGDVSATMNNLNSLISQLFEYKIISKESIDKMKPIIGKETFGRGMMLLPFDEHIFFGHGGDTYGTHTLCSYNEKDKIAISMSINGERYPHNDFAIDILSIIYNKPYKLPNFNDTFKVNYSDLIPLEGLYSNANFPLKLKVFINDSMLHCQASGQASFILTSTGPNSFTYQAAKIEIEFVPNEKKLIFKQNGIKETMMKE